MNVDALTAVLSPVLAEHGLELDHLEVVPAGRRSVVRVSVDGDGPAGRGPLLDQIAEASTALSAALDASSAVADQPYTLEVSSRGVGKPLTEAKHFRRNAGRLVLVTTNEGRQIEGRIREVVEGSDPQLVLEVTQAPQTKGRRPKTVTQSMPMDQITKAVVRIEMNRPLQEGLDDVRLDPDDGDSTQHGDSTHDGDPPDDLDEDFAEPQADVPGYQED